MDSRVYRTRGNSRLRYHGASKRSGPKRTYRGGDRTETAGTCAAMCGGAVGGESVSAKAELATAQPATKAIRLTFIVFTPIELLKVRRCGTPRYDSLRRLKRHPDENSLTLP